MEQINGYRIIKKLGEGAFGETFLAEKNNKKVVIKQLKLSNVERWKTVERFQREGATLQKLDHPSIPNYVELIDADEFLGIVQEYVSGKSWQSLIDSGKRFSPEEIKDYLKQGLDILDYLSKQQLIHRDLNPKNILLDENQKLWFVDFGSVQWALSNHSSTITTMGTFGYMAPEQLMGRATVKSDLFSFGMSLIALTHGSRIDQLPRNEMSGTLDIEVFERLPVDLRAPLTAMVQTGINKRPENPKAAQKLIGTMAKPESETSLTCSIKEGIREYNTFNWQGYVLQQEGMPFVDPKFRFNPMFLVLAILLSIPVPYMIFRNLEHFINIYLMIAIPLFIAILIIVPILEHRINKRCYLNRLKERGRILHFWNDLLILEQNRAPVWSVPLNRVEQVIFTPLPDDQYLCEIKREHLDPKLFCHTFPNKSAAEMMGEKIAGTGVQQDWIKVVWNN